MTTRTRAFCFIASFLILTVMLSSVVSAYVLLSPARRWFSTPKAITIDNGGVASVTGIDGGVAESVTAANWWNSGGVTPVNASAGNVAYVLGDNQADIIFDDPLNICTGNCLAATTTGFYNTGQTGVCTHPDNSTRNVVAITDSDVAFNLSFDYTTPNEVGGCSSEIYLDTVLAHEVGHVIGLGHSGTSSAIMAPSVAFCSHKLVVADDVAGRNDLYQCTTFPGGGGGCTPKNGSCTSNSQCCSGVCKPNGRCR
ncbi:MAG: matrixin family metalloprotease [Candidatus Polarisedimenticolia bacterium]